MGVGNLHNGYVYPQTANVSRARAVQSGYITKGKMGVSKVKPKMGKAPENKTPMTKDPIKHSGFLPRMGNVNKNVGNAPARGFGR